MDLLKDTLGEADESMEKAYKNFEEQLAVIDVSKVRPEMLRGILFDYHGVPAPIEQNASISVRDSSTLLVKPWEKNLIPAMERAIVQKNHYGFSCRHDGEMIYITRPQITEEDRKRLVKEINEKAEHSKVHVRNVRKHAKAAFKEVKSEDEVRRAEDELQKTTDKWVNSIDTLQEKKKKEVMKV